MNGADPLAQLRDIHLPEPVGWWPPAPGWWILAFAVVALIVLSFLLTKKLWLRNRYRRAAIRELKILQNTPPENQQAILEKLSTLLRRVALQTFGRESVAPLSGEKWLCFLDQTGKTDQFTQGPAKVLGYDLYASSPVEKDTKQVAQIIHKWIKEHRR